MSDFILLAVTLVVVMNPPAVVAAIGWPEARRPVVALAALLAALAVFALVVLLAAGADDILDWLKIEPESFRIAAGIVFLVEGARLLVFGPYVFRSALRGWLAVGIPLAFPIFLTPSLAAAAVTYGADEGVSETVWAAAIGIGIAVLGTLVAPLTKDTPAAIAASWGARIFGAALIGFATALIVDGVRAI